MTYHLIGRNVKIWDCCC